MLLGPVGVAAVLTRLRDGFTPLGRRGKGEMLGIEVAQDPFQPDVEEGGKVGVENAAVVGWIGDDRVEGLVVVEELLGVASLDLAWLLDLRKLPYAEGLAVKREWKATRGSCKRTDL